MAEKILCVAKITLQIMKNTGKKINLQNLNEKASQ